MRDDRCVSPRTTKTHPSLLPHAASSPPLFFPHLDLPLRPPSSPVPFPVPFRCPSFQHLGRQFRPFARLRCLHSFTASLKDRTLTVSCGRAELIKSPKASCVKSKPIHIHSEKTLFRALSPLRHNNLPKRAFVCAPVCHRPSRTNTIHSQYQAYGLET